MESRAPRIRFTQNPLRIVRELSLEDQITAAKQLTERPVDMFMRFKKLKIPRGDQALGSVTTSKVVTKVQRPNRSNTFGSQGDGQNGSENQAPQPKSKKPPSQPYLLGSDKPAAQDSWKKQQTAVEKYTVKKILKATIDALPRLLGTLMVLPKDIPEFTQTDDIDRQNNMAYSVTEVSNSKVKQNSDKLDQTSMRSSHVPGERRSRERDSGSKRDLQATRKSHRSTSSQGVKRRLLQQRSGLYIGETVMGTSSSALDAQVKSGPRSRSTDARGASAGKLRSRVHSQSRSGKSATNTGTKIQEHAEFKKWKNKVDVMIHSTADISIRKYGNLVITDLQDTLQNFGRIDRLREMIGGVGGDKGGINNTQASKKMVKLNPVKPRDANQPSVNTKMNGLVGDVQEVEEILRRFLATKRPPLTVDDDESEIVRKMEEIEAVLKDRAKRERVQASKSGSPDKESSESGESKTFRSGSRGSGRPPLESGDD